MPFELSLFSLSAQNSVMQNRTAQLLACNEITQKYGLMLTGADAAELEITRQTALKNTLRIEFGGGIIDKLIKEFCDSPFLHRTNYVETLEQLTEIFYLYKNETLDKLPDDELIKWMGKFFNTTCQGSLELLESRELYALAGNIKAGLPPDYSEPSLNEDEEDPYDE